MKEEMTMCTCKSGSMCSRKHTILINGIPQVTFKTKQEAIEFCKIVKEDSKTPEGWIFEVKCSCGIQKVE